MPTSRKGGQLKSILSIAGLTVMLSGALDATPEARATANFLLFSPSARAAGMGDAYVAIADDAEATFFNPAALANDKERSLSTTFYKPIPSLAG
ncbi:uncharacterized protein METZ01_LOCUS513069, partial [marine metagenome]